MIIFRKAADLSSFLHKLRESGSRIGFVPTMGALHAGHIRLVSQAEKEEPITVCSIFVNPTQFNDANDFAKYPVNIEKDIDLLESSGCDVLFLPSVDEIYPEGTTTSNHYELGFLETILEGKYRPGHFQGVCQVVHRLLEIIMPDTLYLGQKDYQQCMVIRKMIASAGWENKIGLVISTTVREADGLAMSSRNARLNPAERKQAVEISATLQFIKTNIRPGALQEIKKSAFEILSAKDFKVDYVEIANANDLQATEVWDGKTKVVVLAAAYLNEVRLIDNLLIN